ncbi:MAG: protein-L-isoaspartate O-methyltransferase [Pseudomonadota bacterium]
MKSEMDYQKARQSMVDSQIHPMGVVSETILHAFETVPREEFVPEEFKQICYLDEDIEVAKKRFILEPSVLSRLLEEAKIQNDDAVLTIGSGAGYSAAILSFLCKTVVALENNEDFLSSAQCAWDKLGYSNIASIAGPLEQGAEKYAPYDVILFNGAIAQIPKTFISQLKIGGRILAVIRKDNINIAKATIFEKTSDETLASRILFDAGTPFLDGFEPEKEFIF